MTTKGSKVVTKVTTAKKVTRKISAEKSIKKKPRAVSYTIQVDKNVSGAEFSSLMAAVGWGSDYPDEMVSRSLSAYPLVAHARSPSGKLLGYISAFSDGAFSTMLGELVVHPRVQGRGIGRALLRLVEERFSGVPVYVKPLGAAKHFFIACGYQVPAVDMQVLFNRNDAGG